MSRGISIPEASTSELRDQETKWNKEAKTASHLTELLEEIGEIDGEPGTTPAELTVSYARSKSIEWQEIRRMAEEYLRSDSSDPDLARFAQAILDLPTKL